jgi:hypothetical protein
VPKPCIGFKLMAAGRRCATPESVRETFEWAFANIKPIDMVDVGVFQKHANQVAENARIVSEILTR